MGRSLVLAAILASTACTALLGVDFDGRLAPSSSDASDAGDGATDAGGGADGDAISDGGEPDDAEVLPDGFSLAWSRWQTSGQFPMNESFLPDQEKAVDQATGLMWALEPVGTKSWTQADAACAALSLGGFSDWRLPTRIELLSIVSYDHVPSNVSSFKPLLERAWTASPFGTTPKTYWTISLADGAVSHGDGGDDADRMLARCVRGGLVAVNSPPTRWVVTADTIEDTITHLFWARAETFEGNASAASAYCATSSVGGSIGARVPTLQELYTIMDERPTGTSLAVDPVFTSALTATNLTWTATAQADVLNKRWMLDRRTGETSLVDQTGIATVRCVR